MKLSAIISSFDPNRDSVYLDRQRACIASWRDYAGRIILVNRKQDVADIKFVEVVEPIYEHPTLAQMAKIAAIGRGMNDEDSIAIVPCDVFMTGSLDKLADYIKRRQVARCWAGCSYRIENGEEVQWAFDFFATTKKVWKEIKDIPTYLKVGEPMWDIWMNNKLNVNVGGHRYLNLSGMRIVSHEAHEGGRETVTGIKPLNVEGWYPPTAKP